MKIETLNVTRNEVITAVNILFTGKKAVRTQMLTAFNQWTPRYSTHIVYPGEAFDYKGRTLGKFDLISSYGGYSHIKAYRGMIPCDEEYANTQSYAYTLECLNHSCGVRNWFRDVDQSVFMFDDDATMWIKPYGTRGTTKCQQATCAVERDVPFMHEWYAMTRALANPYFVKAYQHDANFSVYAMHMLTTFFWDMISVTSEDGRFSGWATR